MWCDLKPLKAVADIVSGGTPKSGVAEYWANDIHWITPKDMGKLNDVYVSKTGRMISDLGLKKSSAKLFPANSVILSTRAPIGHLAINLVPMSTNQGCRGLIPSLDLDSKYLYYFLYHNREKLNDLGTGTTFKELSKSALAEVCIPSPALETQKQIVAKLDQAFADIEKAKVNAEQNLNNANELLLSQRHEMFHAMSLESDLVPLTSVCDEIFAGGDAPKGNFSKDLSEKYKIPIYANAVKNNGLYGFTDIARALKPAITVAARGSGTGHVAMRMEPFFPIVRLIVLIPNDEIIILEYLKYTILGLDILSSGSAIPQLTVPMIKGYSVPLPSLDVQRLMIGKFNKLSEQIACLESIYKQKISSLDELKQSILQKAFNGELA